MAIFNFVKQAGQMMSDGLEKAAAAAVAASEADIKAKIEASQLNPKDLALKKLGRQAKCETHCTPVYGGDMARLKTFIERAQRRFPHLAPDIVENLANFYGSRIDEVLATADEKPGEREALLKRLAPDNPVIGVQVVHAVRHEMAIHLDDVIFRRTGLGTLGNPGSALVKQVAELMGRELGWDETALANEMAGTLRLFETI